ncbi:unnamed protein product, partial [Owenia fusiformis]
YWTKYYSFSMMKVLCLSLLSLGFINSTLGASIQNGQFDKADGANLAEGVVEMAQYEPYTWPPPPPWQQKAHMARYLAHYADWCVVSSFSEDLGGVPFGELQSFADGTLDESSGTPYFYLAEVSTMLKNIKFNNSVSITVSQAQSDYCSKHQMDPELPTCSRVTLSGKMLAVEGQEAATAKRYLFSRHPDMPTWGSGWYFYKLNIRSIFLLDYYGGAAHVQVDEYYEY